MARITSIDIIDGWWYPTCPKCGGTTKPWKHSNLCSLCNVIDEAPIPCYILNTTAEDEIGQALFMIFDRLAEKLIGVSASTLTSANSANRYVLPQMIKDIYHNLHTFQVTINTNNKKMKSICFKVTKIFDGAVFAQVKEEKQPGIFETVKPIITGNKIEDVLSQESAFSNSQPVNESSRLQDDIQVHTPQKSRSTTPRKAKKNLTTIHLDESNSDDEPISVLFQRNLKRNKREILTIEEPVDNIKKQRNSAVQKKKKGKKQAK
ncbi:uncharacterized protein LOC120000239 [Tripterygium wilfordii]|uniref:uncharacterized protein LOC120000239 n=1 Tax=Tripterygium wilfordii TaxID=458696 RepID=UPI0018F80347|nr:uncharacterized protein LOC120000239 [Tripterygium wilfordii]